MDKTKKLLVLLLALVTAMMFVFAGCGSSEEPQEEESAEVAQDATEESTEVASGDYDIMNGFEKKANEDGSIEYLYFNGFMVTMPGNEKWSVEASP